MSSEMWAVILMITAIVLILLELVWLYIISQKQEEILRKHNKEISIARSQLGAILSSPTKGSRNNEIKTFLDTSSQNGQKLLYASLAYLEFDKKREQFSQARNEILDEAFTQLNPVDGLVKYLKKSNNYQKSYICRCLADLHAADAIEDIEKCLDSKNSTLQYNAGMALSSLGDEKGVIKFLELCENNKKYSHRIILELIDNYSGDKAQLILNYFGDKKKIDDYMKATIIKAVKNDKLIQLKDIYIEGFLAKSYQIRVACIKAIAALGTSDLEQYLITASRDKDWIIRLSSLSGLEKIGSAECFEAVKHVTSDEQWWVRKRAAEALVRMDQNFSYVEDVIKGYDRYASDAVKSVLYKS